MEMNDLDFGSESSTIPRMIDLLNDVPTFVTAVEAGGFSAAARRLHLSRSAVGKAVARLEGRLGVRLFQRTTRSQSLTDDGQAFYEHCQRAIGELQAGQAMLESGRKVASGKLRISMPVLFGRLCAAPVLTRLAERNPELELELDFRDDIVDLIHDRFDLVIRNGPLGDGPGLMTRRIGFERTMVCASPSYVERHGQPTKLSDLTRHQAITYCRNGRIQTWLFPRERALPQQVTPQSRFRFNDLGAIVDAAANGLGLAWLPNWLVNDRIAAGTLIRILPGESCLVGHVNAIWPEAPHLPMRVRVAIDALAKETLGIAD